jgi:hypothetical protein
MNRYQSCADTVRNTFDVERTNAVSRGASAERLAHIDTSIHAATELTDRLEEANSVPSALALVKEYRDELEAAQTGRENEPGITACLLVRDALNAL